MKTRRNLVFLLLIWILVVSVTACSLFGDDETPAETPPPTKVSLLTPSGKETETPTPSEEATTAPTEETAPPPTSTESPPVTTESGCTLGAAYVADVSIPDNTAMVPGENFVKTWRIRNSGTCEWEAGTKMVFASGEPLGTASEVAMPTTAPGAEVEVGVDMVAPSDSGTYRSNWQLQAPDGTRFGGLFYVQIVVNEPTAEPTEEPAPPTGFSGAVAGDCSQVTFTWTDGRGEAGYRLEGTGGLSANLEADTTSYTWSGPPDGSRTVTLIAIAEGGAEIGRVSTTINVSCAPAEPDLVVESVAFDPAPVAYMPVNVTLRVRNRGGSGAGSFQVRWWGGKNFASPSCSWNVGGGLTAGATTDLTCDYAYGSPYGNIVSKAQVDIAGAVDESDESNNVLEKSTAVVSPITVYDLVAKADRALWQGSPPLSNLPFPGDEADDQGFALWLTSGRWETGGTISGTALETHPKWVANGEIWGTYTDIYSSGYRVQAGDRFRASVAFLQGAGNGDVTYKVMIRASEAGGNFWIGEVRHTYGEGFETIDVDLTPYAGSRADFILKVEAGSSSSQDWACWDEAVIYRYP
ncbi:MAG: NBR1-Ig-like domain-containing protein [Anaerolineae bacterium]